MLIKPRDRDVVCHASAWDVDLPKEDVRMKMCIEADEDNLYTIHHELGHIYYYLMYKSLTPLFWTGAHDGFHEAVGDAVTLSLTPAHMQKIDLVDKVQTDQRSVINAQMKLALDKIAFLPFGKLIDQWRWRVFAGEVKPAEYNAAWWRLRTYYQGVSPPVARSEADFDPGAKYHVPGNTPYTRYFLAHILQFQFHKALCQAAGQTGALHECDVYGSKEAGKKFGDMLAMGASKPWPEALESLTGTRKMDAEPMIEYFTPLMSWFKEQNTGRECGWTELPAASPSTPAPAGAAPGAPAPTAPAPTAPAPEAAEPPAEGGGET
jgi:peptidyl-dipeptidase A